MATGLESAFDQEEEDELTGIAFQEGFTPAPATTNYDAGSGYRGEPTPPVVAPVVSSDPFADFGRISAGGKDITAKYSDDPLTYADTLASEDIPYMQYSDEALSNVTFDTVDARGGDYSNFGGRLISGDTEEYDNTYSYNNMLSRGIDEQTAQEWLNKGGTAQEANDIIADKFVNQKDNLTSAFDTLREEGNTTAFQEQWGETGFDGKVAYLNNLQESGELDKESYEKAWRDEWNLSQQDSPNPTWIVEMQAPRDWDAGDSIYKGDDSTKIKYKAGDTIFVTYSPDGIDPENNIGVVQSGTYYPNLETKGLELQYYDNVGPRTENLAAPSEWLQFREEFLKPGLRTIAAAASGGMSEAAYTAARGLAGETLHGGDWATLGLAGLNLAGITAPPTEVLDPSTGQMVMSAGTGIGGLSYGQTQGLINAAATGNPTAFLVNEFGGDIVSSALDKIGINSDNLSPEVLAGIGRTVDKLLVGEDFDSALESGVGEWARESNIGGELEDTLRTVGRDFDDKYLQPIKDSLPEGMDFPDTPEGIKAIEDVARDIGSGIADAGTPIKEGVEEIGSSIAEAAEPLKEPLQETGRFIDDNLLQPAKDALLDAGGAMLTGMAGGGQPSGTRTTDSLFRDELFKFKEKDLGLVERVVQDAPREQIVDFNDDPFASDFNNRNLFG